MTLQELAVEEEAAPAAPAKLLIKQTNEGNELERARLAYAVYQENIKKSDQLQIEILKGLHAGESTARLLIKACECISAMTGNGYFADQVHSRIVEQYGGIFHDPGSLEIERQELEERLDKLKANGGSNAAIRAHENRLNEIKSSLQQIK